MVSKDVTSWLRNQRNAGFTENKLRSMLKEQGYSPEEIDAAWTHSVSDSPPLPPKHELHRMVQEYVRAIHPLTAVIFLVVYIVLSAYFHMVFPAIFMFAVFLGFLLAVERIPNLHLAEYVAGFGLVGMFLAALKAGQHGLTLNPLVIFLIVVTLATACYWFKTKKHAVPLFMTFFVSTTLTLGVGLIAFLGITHFLLPGLRVIGTLAMFFLYLPLLFIIPFAFYRSTALLLERTGEYDDLLFLHKYAAALDVLYPGSPTRKSIHKGIVWGVVLMVVAFILLSFAGLQFIDQQQDTLQRRADWAVERYNGLRYELLFEEQGLDAEFQLIPFYNGGNYMPFRDVTAFHVDCDAYLSCRRVLDTPEPTTAQYTAEVQTAAGKEVYLLPVLDSAALQGATLFKNETWNTVFLREVKQDLDALVSDRTTMNSYETLGEKLGAFYTEAYAHDMAQSLREFQNVMIVVNKARQSSTVAMREARTIPPFYDGLNESAHQERLARVISELRPKYTPGMQYGLMGSGLAEVFNFGRGPFRYSVAVIARHHRFTSTIRGVQSNSRQAPLVQPLAFDIPNIQESSLSRRMRLKAMESTIIDAIFKETCPRAPDKEGCMHEVIEITRDASYCPQLVHQGDVDHCINRNTRFAEGCESFKEDPVLYTECVRA